MSPVIVASACTSPREVFTCGVDEKKSARKNIKRGLKTILDFLFMWNTSRMDVINTRDDLIRVPIMLERFISALDASIEMTSASRRWMDGKMSSKSE